MATTAWTIYTHANFFFDKNKNKKLANKKPSLQFYGMIILQRIGMVAIPTMYSTLFEKKETLPHSKPFFKLDLDLYEIYSHIKKMRCIL